MNPALKDHFRISLMEKLKRPLFSKCDKHHEDKKIYCSSCRDLKCNMCIIDDHADHTTISIFKYGDQIKSELIQSLSGFNAVISSHLQKEVYIRTEISRKARKIEQLIEEIRKIEDEMKQKKKLKKKN